MRRILKTFSVGLAVALLAACASTPQQRFASSVEAAQSAKRPLVVYRFAHTRVAERVPFRSAQKFDAYIGVAVINTAQQPIQKLVFSVADYRGNQPILSPDGKPVTGELIATGPFASGSSFAVVSKTPIWTTTVASNDSCPRLTGIEVEYRDGSRVAVPAEIVRSYLTPQINVNCANYPAYILGPEDLRFGNINGPIGYVPQYVPAGGKPGGGR